MRKFFRFAVLVLVGLMFLSFSPSRAPRWSNVAWNSNEPPNPSQNIPPVPNFQPTSWSINPLPICYQLGQTAACDLQMLQAINHAHSVEGIPPISLPSDYATLPYDVQSFIIVNLERISYGETPITGITRSLDTAAVGGIVNSTDPTITPNPSYLYGSDWYGATSPNSGNPLMADYVWMYMDGWGGSKANTQNIICTSPTSSSCWGHRQMILWNPGGQRFAALGGSVHIWVVWRNKNLNNTWKNDTTNQ